MSLLPADKEETPLLLLFIDDTPWSPRKKDLHANNARYKHPYPIRRGLDWPGYIAICCWVCLIFIIFFSTLLIMLLSPHYYPITLVSRTPGCQEQDVRVYTVHFGKWKPYQFQAVANIVAKYPGVPVHILDLWNATKPLKNHHQYKSAMFGKRKLYNITRSEVDYGRRKSYVRYLHDQIHSIKSLLEMYPDVIYSKETMKNYFSQTPLYRVWKLFDLEMVDLAARVIPLWEFGGISIKLPSGANTDWRMETPTFGNLSTFYQTPTGVVNVDERAVHMETKAPCHSFFEEVIRNFRAAGANDTMQTIFNATMDAFSLTDQMANMYSS